MAGQRRFRSDPVRFGCSMLVHLALAGYEIKPPETDEEVRKLARDVARDVRRAIAWQEKWDRG